MTAKTTKTPTTQQCKRCGEIKPLDKFRADKRQPLGVAGNCKACRMQAEMDSNQPEQKALYRSVERAKRLGVLSLLIIDDVLEIKSATKCAYCQRSIDRVTGELDHVLPMALGYENIPQNVVHACASCNRRKQERNVYDFMVVKDPGNLGTAKYNDFCESFAAKNGAPGNGQAVADAFLADYLAQGAKPVRQEGALP